MGINFLPTGIEFSTITIIYILLWREYLYLKNNNQIIP